MVLVVQADLLALPLDLLDAVVVCSVQIRQLPQKLVSLATQAVQTKLDVVEVGVVSYFSSLQPLDLVDAFLNSVVTLINLGFKGLDHTHLPLEVLRKVVIINDESVTLPLEHTEL